MTTTRFLSTTLPTVTVALAVAALAAHRSPGLAAALGAAAAVTGTQHLRAAHLAPVADVWTHGYQAGKRAAENAPTTEPEQSPAEIGRERARARYGTTEATGQGIEWSAR